MSKNTITISVLIGLFLIIAIIGGGFIYYFSTLKNNNNPEQIRSDNYSYSTSTPMPTSTTTPTGNLPAKAESNYRVILETDLGNIVLELTKDTPVTTGNFVGLAEKGFYNNTIFHRTIKDFMIQGGDPTGTGRGGPGYKFNDEPFTGEYTRGTIAMANSGPNTNGSQFFIMHADVPLQKNYVIFGKVVEGLDVVDKIATAPVEISDSGEMSSPVTPVHIKTAKVEKLD